LPSGLNNKYALRRLLYVHSLQYVRLVLITCKTRSKPVQIGLIARSHRAHTVSTQSKPVSKLVLVSTTPSLALTRSHYVLISSPVRNCNLHPCLTAKNMQCILASPHSRSTFPAAQVVIIIMTSIITSILTWSVCRVMLYHTTS